MKTADSVRGEENQSGNKAANSSNHEASAQKEMEAETLPHHKNVMKIWLPKVNQILDSAHQSLKPLESVFLVSIVLTCTILCLYITYSQLELRNQMKLMQEEVSKSKLVTYKWRKKIDGGHQDFSDILKQVKLRLMAHESSISDLRKLLDFSDSHTNTGKSILRIKRESFNDCTFMGLPGPLGMP